MVIKATTNGADFAARMRKRAETIKFDVVAKVITYSSTLLKTLYPETPYLTGQARANWQVSIGVPTTSFIPIAQTKQYDSETVQRSMDAGLATISNFKSGDILWIVNNSPYIQQLNDGSSKQAPAGFVENAIAAAHSSMG